LVLALGGEAARGGDRGRNPAARCIGIQPVVGGFLHRFAAAFLKAGGGAAMEAPALALIEHRRQVHLKRAVLEEESPPLFAQRPLLRQRPERLAQDPQPQAEDAGQQVRRRRASQNGQGGEDAPLFLSQGGEVIALDRF
jgi:hypothetical protein